MIRHIINNHLPDGLEYGTIYVFTDLYAPKQLLDDYVLAMQHACQQAYALQRFELQVLYADISPTLVARRFNAGNIGKEALLTCPVCGDISIDLPDHACLIQGKHSLTGGSHYRVTRLPGFRMDEIWLCPVTLFVLGQYPKYLYIKKS